MKEARKGCYFKHQSAWATQVANTNTHTHRDRGQRQRQTETQRDRQTDTERHRQRQRERQTHRGTETDRRKDREKKTERQRQTDRQGQRGRTQPRVAVSPCLCPWLSTRLWRAHHDADGAGSRERPWVQIPAALPSAPETREGIRT